MSISRPPPTRSPTAPGVVRRWQRWRRPGHSAPTARRACTRRASSRRPSRPRSISASTSSPSAAATCARRSRVASSSSVSGELVLAGRRATRCGSPGSRRPWRGRERRGRRRCSGISATAGTLPPHLHVQVANAGAARDPGARDAGPRRGLARPLPGSLAAARPARAGSRRGRPAGSPARRHPGCAAALLRRSARDRARVPASTSTTRTGAPISTASTTSPASVTATRA